MEGGREVGEALGIGAGSPCALRRDDTASDALLTWGAGELGMGR